MAIPRAACQCVRCLWSMVVMLVMTLRLIIFSLLLMPPFLTVGWHYFTDSRIRRGVRFGPKPRQYLDIYVPAEAAAAQSGTGPRVPVVVAIMGGAWVIGHRAWNAQLGRRMMDAGVIVVAVDYRNYPFARVPDMLDDLESGLSWVFENIASYGGDPDKVMLMGQSAGAHLSSLLLLRRCLTEAADQAADLEQGSTNTPGAKAPCLSSEDGTWRVSSLRGFVGVSGPYDLQRLASHLDGRGLASGILRMMCPNGDLGGHSPVQFLQSSAWQAAGERTAARLPPILLFHGEADKTVPSACSVEFAEALRCSGAPSVSADVRAGLAHAEPVIEGPMRGEDHQIQLLLPFLLGGESGARLDSLPPLRPMYPKCIINFASLIMPF